MSDIPMIKNTRALARLVYKNVFTPAECETILSFAADTQEAYLQNQVVNKEIRDTKSRAFTKTQQNDWIFDRIFKVVDQVNQKYYNFNIFGLGEVHILEYVKDCFYDWHTDLGSTDITCTRKISLILFLSDPADYEGGKIQFEISDRPDNFAPSQEHGSLVLFPSFLPHKVNPVTSGIRKVLIAWAHGDTFS